MTASAWRTAVLLAALLMWPLPGSRAATESLRGVEGLARAYDAILDARFDDVRAELSRACGPAPAEACHVIAATALWWQILLDPENRDLDDDFTGAVEHAIRTTEAWTERAPNDADAWFYLGGAYAARVQWRVLRDEKLAAARDGKRIKESLERAIELNPALDDAYFGLGMYKYYADVAPAAARILRFLLLLPGGDREEGLQEMLRARKQGRLLQGEADYQLHLIYLWYERDVDRALQLLRALREEYPGNPLFVVHTADIQHVYRHDIMASLETWRSLLAAAREHRVNAARIAEVRARLAIARHLDALHQTDLAVEQLEAVVAMHPAAPYGSLSLAYLQLGEARDRLGERDAAVAAYRAALSTVPSADPHEIRTKAASHVRRAPDARRAEAYRLALEGWRRFERKDLAGAASALERSIALNASDPVARYRYGRVLQAQEAPAALTHYELAIGAARACPPTILGAAYIDAARLHERAGHRDRAITYYRTASTLFGAAEDTRAAARRALTRLQTK